MSKKQNKFVKASAFVLATSILVSPFGATSQAQGITKQEKAVAYQASSFKQEKEKLEKSIDVLFKRIDNSGQAIDTDVGRIDYYSIKLPEKKKTIFNKAHNELLDALPEMKKHLINLKKISKEVDKAKKSKDLENLTKKVAKVKSSVLQTEIKAQRASRTVHTLFGDITKKPFHYDEILEIYDDPKVSDSVKIKEKKWGALKKADSGLSEISDYITYLDDWADYFEEIRASGALIKDVQLASKLQEIITLTRNAEKDLKKYQSQLQTYKKSMSQVKKYKQLIELREKVEYTVTKSETQYSDVLDVIEKLDEIVRPLVTPATDEQTSTSDSAVVE